MIFIRYLYRYLIKIYKLLFIALILGTYCLALPEAILTNLIAMVLVQLSFLLLIGLGRYFYATIPYSELLDVVFVFAFLPSFYLLSLSVIPHVFLFFSALPITFSYPLFVISFYVSLLDIFLLVDSCLREDLVSYDNYSLIKILLMPFHSFKRLHTLLSTNTELAMIQLSLRSGDIETLDTRFNHALTALKEKLGDAFIDDEAIYHAECHKLNVTATNQTEALLNQAKNNALEIINQKVERYQTSLNEEEQAQYQAYRDATLELYLNAECKISYNEIILNRNIAFIISERRYLGSDNTMHVVMGTKNIYEKDCYFKNMELKDTPREPFHDLPLFTPPFYTPSLPINSRAYPTHYKYYDYKQIQGHAVCFTLCELMEKFTNLIPQAQFQIEANALAPQMNQQSSTTAVPSFPVRTRPNTGLNSLSMFHSVTQQISDDYDYARRLNSELNMPTFLNC